MWSVGQERTRGTSKKLQREHENKTKNKNRNKERSNITKHMTEKDRIRALLDRESLVLVPAASHPIPSPDRNHAPIRLASTAPYSGFQVCL